METTRAAAWAGDAATLVELLQPYVTNPGYMKYGEDRLMVLHGCVLCIVSFVVC
jgi:hypothetical protein